MAEEQLKTCTVCANTKKLSEFSFRNKSKMTYHCECKTCNAQRSRNYYRDNKEDCLIKDIEYRKNNTEKLSIQKKEYYNLHSNMIKTKQSVYRKTPIGIICKKNDTHKRRTKFKQGDVTSQQILELQQNAKVCYWCNASLESVKINVDHYVPLSKGGLHTLSNLVVSCASCNLKKQAKDPILFANSIGRLL